MDWLKQRFHASDHDLLEALGHPPLGETVPLQIFAEGLGILEALVLHLVKQGKHPGEVAAFLNRQYSTVANTLRKAKSKERQPAPEDVPQLRVPVTIFRDRLNAPLQALVAYLREHEGMRFTDIARALNRDPRNINATYRQVMRS